MTQQELLDEALWLLRECRWRLDAATCCNRTVGNDRLLAARVDALLAETGPWADQVGKNQLQSIRKASHKSKILESVPEHEQVRIMGRL